MNEIFLTIRAKPNSSRNQVGGSHGEALVVAVTAPAVDGRATEAIIGLLAKALDVPKSAFRVKSGQHARTKILGIAIDSGRTAELSMRIVVLMTEIGAP